MQMIKGIVGLRRRMKLTLSVLAIAALGMAAFVAPAQAGRQHAWSEFLPSNTWGSWHGEPGTDSWWEDTLSLFNAFAAYQGSGTAHVCEQTQVDFSGTGWTLISEACGANSAFSGSLRPWDGGFKRTRVKNNSEFAHTIVGGVETP
jgi:opacity protein-like surface antigen